MGLNRLRKPGSALFIRTEPDSAVDHCGKHLPGREFVNRFGKIDWKKMYAEADHLLAKLNLRFKSDKLVGELSIGDQQMVEIAKVLSFESKVIIMDEPTDALTDTETDSLFRVIRELKSQGRGIVYISHRMKEIRNLR